MKFHSLKVLVSILFLLIYTIQALSQELRLINSTFLGGEGRNYYGNTAPNQLNLKWKYYLGKGKTTISRKLFIQWKS